MRSPDKRASLECWIDWLLNLHAEEIDLGLERIRQVANRLKVTRPAPLVISVAGTNGKGSSVAMLVAILKAAGYRVGAYTSPHIQFFNERIQIEGLPVGDASIVQAFSQIEQAREATKLTYFEFATLAALTIFKQACLDVVVLEVGLGGRLDAVNVVDADLALITAIDIDHVEWLGDDRSVIATEKAGIMRSGKLAVCSDPFPPESLKRYADQHSVPFIQLNQDFVLEQAEQYWSILWQSGRGGGFFSWFENSSFIQLPYPSLKGEFQVQNAAGVVVALQALTERRKGRFSVDKESIIKGLTQARHPGRLELLERGHQTWLVDVAHNPQSANALALYLQQETQKNESSRYSACYTAIFSVLKDKDALPMVKVMMPFISHWVVADLGISRAMPVSELVALLLQAGVDSKAILVQESVQEAVEFIQKQATNKILVWGSFFTVSQVYAYFEK